MSLQYDVAWLTLAFPLSRYFVAQHFIATQCIRNFATFYT